MQKTLLLTAPAGGASEGLQQLWANFNAKYLSEYDPARRLDDEIIRSILIGTIVDATAATGGQAAPTLVKVFRPESATAKLSVVISE